MLLVGSSGLEPPTSRLSVACSSQLSYEPVSFLPSVICSRPSFASSYLFVRHLTFFSKVGGDDGIRTHDPLLAGQVLSQLSYTPILINEFSLSLYLFLTFGVDFTPLLG